MNPYSPDLEIVESFEIFGGTKATVYEYPDGFKPGTKEAHLLCFFLKVGAETWAAIPFFEVAWIGIPSNETLNNLSSSGYRTMDRHYARGFSDGEENVRSLFAVALTGPLVEQ